MLDLHKGHKMLNIIHLSDIHLDSDIENLALSEFIRQLVNDLKIHVNENSILCISGDLVDKGGGKISAANPINKFWEIFVMPIIQAIPYLKGRVFVVPGNHEVQRADVNEFAAIGIKTQLANETAVNNFYENNRSKLKHLEHLRNFIEFQNDKLSDYPGFTYNNFYMAGSLIVGEQNIGVVCLNSAWTCFGDVPKGDVILSIKQLEDALEVVAGADIKIVIIHHPIEYFKEYEVSQIRTLLASNSDVLLTGHVHDYELMQCQSITGSLFISTADTTTSPFSKVRKNYKNGYSVIQINHESVDVYLRKYIGATNTFVSNTDVGNDNGRIHFNRSQSENRLNAAKIGLIITGIENRYFERLNEHIVVCTELSHSKPTINRIFVEPEITNAPAGVSSDSKEEAYTIDSILNENSHYILIGPKEAGKTLLLDKMLIEAVRGFHKYRKIPAYIKFKDIEKRPIEKLIIEFLSINEKEYSELIRHHKIVLIIDDVLFHSKNENVINGLSIYLNSHPQIQLVCSTREECESLLPMKYFDYSGLLKPKFGYIQCFDSKRIRALIDKWYDGTQIDKFDKIESVIKGFSELGLPKNPLSITLFLWVFENQERRPINTSVLVENYIEKLLEKANFENAYSDTFDYHNKLRLLYHIAKFMNDNGDPYNGYTVEYATLLQFSKEYLKGKYHGSPQTVIDDLVCRGILSRDECDAVRFKFAFLFQFCMAIYIKEDRRFYDEIISGNDFLNYAEELKFYAGLKRDDTRLLKFSLDKLESAFLEYNSVVFEKRGQFDALLSESEKTDDATFVLKEPNNGKKVIDSNADAVYDSQLNCIETKSLVGSKDIKISDLKEKAGDILYFASSIFKNSEEVDDYKLRVQAFKSICRSSISYMFLYRTALIQYFERNKKIPDHLPQNISIDWIVRIMPLINQVALHTWLGNPKFRDIFLDSMRELESDKDSSELEKLTVMFLYSDSKCTNYSEELKKFISSVSTKSIKRLIYLKIYTYYHMRKNPAQLDDEYLRIMTKLQCDIKTLKSRDIGSFIKKQIDKRNEV